MTRSIKSLKENEKKQPRLTTVVICLFAKIYTADSAYTVSLCHSHNPRGSGSFSKSLKAHREQWAGLSSVSRLSISKFCAPTCSLMLSHSVHTLGSQNPTPGKVSKENAVTKEKSYTEMLENIETV